MEQIFQTLECTIPHPKNRTPTWRPLPFFGLQMDYRFNNHVSLLVQERLGEGLKPRNKVGIGARIGALFTGCHLFSLSSFSAFSKLVHPWFRDTSEKLPNMRPPKSFRINTLLFPGVQDETLGPFTVPGVEKLPQTDTVGQTWSPTVIARFSSVGTVLSFGIFAPLAGFREPRLAILLNQRKLLRFLKLFSLTWFSMPKNWPLMNTAEF